MKKANAGGEPASLGYEEAQGLEKYWIGDTCYIIEDGEVRRGRVSAKKGDNFFVQFVGSCGALQVKSEELYRTLEEAQVELDREAQERPHVGYL